MIFAINARILKIGLLLKGCLLDFLIYCFTAIEHTYLKLGHLGHCVDQAAFVGDRVGQTDEVLDRMELSLIGEQNGLSGIDSDLSSACYVAYMYTCVWNKHMSGSGEEAGGLMRDTRERRSD